MLVQQVTNSQNDLILIRNFILSSWSCNSNFFVFNISVLVKRRIWSSIKVKGRTPVTQTSTKVTAAANTKEVVRYTSESVQIGPNTSYEDVTYPEEELYDYCS